jgi:hypothetical protein
VTGKIGLDLITNNDRLVHGDGSPVPVNELVACSTGICPSLFLVIQTLIWRKHPAPCWGEI